MKIRLKEELENKIKGRAKKPQRLTFRVGVGKKQSVPFNKPAFHREILK